MRTWNLDGGRSWGLDLSLGWGLEIWGYSACINLDLGIRKDVEGKL